MKISISTWPILFFEVSRERGGGESSIHAFPTRNLSNLLRSWLFLRKLHGKKLRFPDFSAHLQQSACTVYKQYRDIQTFGFVACVPNHLLKRRMSHMKWTKCICRCCVFQMQLVIGWSLEVTPHLLWVLTFYLLGGIDSFCLFWQSRPGSGELIAETIKVSILRVQCRKQNVWNVNISLQRNRSKSKRI